MLKLFTVLSSALKHNYFDVQQNYFLYLAKFLDFNKVSFCAVFLIVNDKK